MIKNKVLLAVALLTLLLGLAVLGTGGRTGSLEEKAPRVSAPELAFEDYEGRLVSLSPNGLPLVLNSWAAWCPFCIKELLDFAAVQEEFAGRVVIIAINRAEPLDTAKSYTDELGVTDKLVFLLDPDDAFYRMIGGFVMPETLFVDREGGIRFHKRGPMTRDEIRERVSELLQ